MRPCFKFKAKAGDKPAVLAIDDEIGFWGTQAKDFRASLDAVEGNELIVDINSPGGEVMAGLGMFNMLRNWASAEDRTVTTRVTGIAASIASVIALAGDKRVMPKNAFAMVHQASGLAWGTAEELRDTADVLDKIDNSLKSVYIDRMGVDEAKAAEIMAKDTWLTAEECLELGFATELSDAVQATAKFDVARAELPDHVAAVFTAKESAPEPEPVPAPEPEGTADPDPQLPDTPVAKQIADLAAEAKLGDFSAHFALSCETVEAAQARIKTALEITALCDLAKKPEFAAHAIKVGKDVAAVRTELLTALAEEDEAAPTSTVRTDESKGGATASSGLNPTALWNLHNAQAKKDAK